MNKHSAQFDQHWPPYTASRNWDTFFLTAAIIPTSRTKPSKKPCQNSQICTKQVLPCQPLRSNRSSFWSVFMPVVRLTCKFWISSGGWQAMNKYSAQSDQDWPPYTASRNWHTFSRTAAIIPTKRNQAKSHVKTVKHV